MKTATKERPILFSAPMVRAILDGRKTQTRRVINRMVGFKVSQFDQSDTKGYDWHFRCQRGMWQDMDHAEVISRCPYGQAGDRLWVRESWAVGNIYDNVAPSKICRDILDQDGYSKTKAPCGVRYSANQECIGIRVRPSIHMPRWASRITLEITDVRVERLNDITEADAQAEGVEKLGEFGSFRCDFIRVWESINGPGSWAANPWVWVVEFKQVVP